MGDRQGACSQKSWPTKASNGGLSPSRDGERLERWSYYSKEQETEAVKRENIYLPSSKHSETLDPEEDYHYRFQQQQHQIARLQWRRVNEDDASDSERNLYECGRRRDTEEYYEAYTSLDGHSESITSSQTLVRYHTWENKFTPYTMCTKAFEEPNGRRNKRESVVDLLKETRMRKLIQGSPRNRSLRTRIWFVG